MGKGIYDLLLHKKKFNIENINFDSQERNGTCHLVSTHHKYILIWTIKNYPTEIPGMPGSLYPIEVSYSIINNIIKQDTPLQIIKGTFILELNSGILTIYSGFGLPYGIYKSITTYNHKTINITFNILENNMSVFIYE